MAPFSDTVGRLTGSVTCSKSPSLTKGCLSDLKMILAESTEGLGDGGERMWVKVESVEKVRWGGGGVILVEEVS